MKGGKAAIGLLVAGFLSSCSILESDSLPFGSGMGFFESSHLQNYAPKGALRLGGIYRPARKNTWPTSVAALSEMCEKDIESLHPESREDTFDNFDQTYSRHQFNSLFGAFFPSIEISHYIESVRIQYHGVTRHLLRDSELDRIRHSVRPTCRDFLFARHKDGYNLFFISGVVVAENASFSILGVFRPEVFLDLAKLTLGAFIGSFVQGQQDKQVPSKVRKSSVRGFTPPDQAARRPSNPR